LIIEKVWLPKRCMWRKLFGMPRSDIVIVTWCSDSGTNVQKSQLLALPQPMKLSRWCDCAFKGKRSTVVHTDYEFDSAEQPLTSSPIPA
jgi:hypothetical protein